MIQKSEKTNKKTGKDKRSAKKVSEKTTRQQRKQKKEKVYAVVEIGGGQQLVSVGDKITVNRVDYKEGEQFVVDKLLMTIDGDKFEIGDPYLKNKVALFRVVEHKKGKKVTVIKFRAKARYRRKKGHRQLLSVLEFVKITSNLKSYVKA